MLKSIIIAAVILSTPVASFAGIADDKKTHFEVGPPIYAAARLAGLEKKEALIGCIAVGAAKEVADVTLNTGRGEIKDGLYTATGCVTAAVVETVVRKFMAPPKKAIYTPRLSRETKAEIISFAKSIR